MLISKTILIVLVLIVAVTIGGIVAYTTLPKQTPQQTTPTHETTSPTTTLPPTTTPLTTPPTTTPPTTTPPTTMPPTIPQTTTTVGEEGKLLIFNTTIDILNTIKHLKYSMRYQNASEYREFQAEFTVLAEETVDGEASWKVEGIYSQENQSYKLTVWISKSTGNPVKLIIETNGETTEIPKEYLQIMGGMHVYMLFMPMIMYSESVDTIGIQIRQQAIEAAKEGITLTYSPEIITIGGNSFNGYSIKFTASPISETYSKYRISGGTIKIANIVKNYWSLTYLRVDYTDGSWGELEITELTLA